MLKAIRAMLFYLDRWREDERSRKEAMGEFIRNGWRCSTLDNAMAVKKRKSYRRYTNNAAHYQQ